MVIRATPSAPTCSVVLPFDLMVEEDDRSFSLALAIAE